MAFVALHQPAVSLLAINALAIGGVTADGVADDWNGLVAAVAAAKNSSTRQLYLPNRTYRVSQRIDVSHIAGFHIVGAGARIIYPSDDTSLVADATASVQAARCAFYVRHSANVTIEGVTFIGGSSGDLDRNIGPGIYATRCSYLTISNCFQLGGDAIVEQDVQVDTRGTGDSLTFDAATGYVTLVDAAAPFVEGHGNGARTISINNTNLPRNGGTFSSVTYVSPTTVKFYNPAGASETSSFRWSIDDGDRGLRIMNGGSFGCRGSITPPIDTRIYGHTFELPDTHDVVCYSGTLAVSGTTVTLSTMCRRATTKLIGRPVVIAGATTAAHNTTSKVTSVTARSGNTPASITWENATGGIVSEAFGGTVWVLNGEKSGTGAGVGAITLEGGTVTADAGTDTFTRVGHGYSTGTNVRFSSTGTTPGNVTAATDYYAIRLTADTFKIATTIANAHAGTARDVTSAGTGTITVSAGTTLTVADANAFHSSDFQKLIRTHGSTSSANRGAWSIQIVHSATQVTYNNHAGVAEAFSGPWTVDGYDRVGGSSAGTGSSHAIYIPAGRSDIVIAHCSFSNVRKSAVKISGSSLLSSSIDVVMCHFYRCGNAITAGADDSQEHNGISIIDCTFEDCGVGREGWSDLKAIDVLGSRGVNIVRSRNYLTQNAIASVDGRGMAGHYGIHAGRYLPDSTRGDAQPLESLNIDGATFERDPDNTSVAGTALTACVQASYVGQRAYWATAGTLTKSGTTMTLTDTEAKFSAQLVGQTIEHAFAPDAANNGVPATILSVSANGTSLTYDNAAGVGGGVSAGTYRIYPGQLDATNTWVNGQAGLGGALRIRDVTSMGVGSTTVQTVQCLAPSITGISWTSTGGIKCSGDVMPLIDDVKEVGGTTGNAHVQLAGVAWAIIGSFFRPVNLMHFAINASARDITVGIGATVVDHPLQGMRGRARSSDGYEEVVIGYGDGFVDGDMLTVNSTVFTYKRVGPTGNQFNSATTLISAINTAMAASVLAADYGTRLPTPTATAIGHIHIRRITRSTSDAGGLNVRSRTLNSTALVVLRNATSGSPFVSHCFGRGAASAGPVPDKAVAWTPLASHSGTTTLVPDNAAGRTILASGSYMQLRNTNDGGCCAVLQLGSRTDDGALTDLGGEWRWRL